MTVATWEDESYGGALCGLGATTQVTGKVETDGGAWPAGELLLRLH